MAGTVAEPVPVTGIAGTPCARPRRRGRRIRARQTRARSAASPDDHCAPSAADLVPQALALADRWVAATAGGAAPPSAGPPAGSPPSWPTLPAWSSPCGSSTGWPGPRTTGWPPRELARARGGLRPAARFLGPVDRTLLRLGALARARRAAPRGPGGQARGCASSSGTWSRTPPDLTGHIAAARADGFRLNLNLLGEAVLGEAEANDGSPSHAAWSRGPTSTTSRSRCPRSRASCPRGTPPAAATG